jgi:hypothetical protein
MAYNRSIYQDVTLTSYIQSDPVAQHELKVNKVNNDIARLQAELEVLRNENN